MPYDAITSSIVEKIDYVSGATDTELYPDSNNISIFCPSGSLVSMVRT